MKNQNDDPLPDDDIAVMLHIKDGKFEKLFSHEKETVYKNADIIADVIITQIKNDKNLKHGLWAFAFNNDWSGFDYQFIGD